MTVFRFMALVVMSSVLTGCVLPTVTSAELGNTRQTSAGSILADGEGMTLSTYDADQPGIAKCTGMCAFSWRSAGVKEDAEERGDVTGDGVDSVWHVVRP